MMPTFTPCPVIPWACIFRIPNPGFLPLSRILAGSKPSGIFSAGGQGVLLSKVTVIRTSF